MCHSRTYLNDHAVRQGDPDPLPPDNPNPEPKSISDKQLQANRENAKLSTGPRTPEGKATSSRNAVKHGLFARDVLLKSPHHNEDPKEFISLLESLFEELKPETQFQEHLVRKIANCLWRSRRAIVAETARINRDLSHVDREVSTDYQLRSVLNSMSGEEPDAPTQEAIDDCYDYHIGTSLVPDQRFGRNVLWYEMRLDRQLARAYGLLNLLKRRLSPPLDPNQASTTQAPDNASAL